MMLPTPLVVALLAGGGILLAGSAIPTGQGEVDLRVKVSLASRALGGEWRIEDILVEDEPSRLINLGAVWHNSLSLLDGKRRAVLLMLESPSGAVLQRESGRTGTSGLLPETESETMVLRRVPPGEYVVRVKLRGEAGTTVDEATEQVIVLEAT